MTVPGPVIAVAGPPSAGVSSLVRHLGARLPECLVVEAAEATAPDAVVVAASAAAPLARSDVDLIERVTARTGLVVGAVTKVDAHRDWRGVLAADAEALIRRDRRYRRASWVGVAAAPDLGDPDADELVAILRAGLCDPELASRNRLRAAEFDADRTRRRRSERSAAGVALRAEVQRARLALRTELRHMCAALGADLRATAAELPRGATAGFEGEVRVAAAGFGAALDGAIRRAVDDVAIALALPPPGPWTPPAAPPLPPPRPASRRLETRLMAVLGGGFGLGAALTLSRVLSQLSPGLDVPGLATGGAVGLLLTIWVVHIRGLLYDRALLERWVGEVTATLRSRGEEMVAGRLLEAEIAFTESIYLLGKSRTTTIDGTK